jgi:hypothetical protein
MRRLAPLGMVCLRVPLADAVVFSIGARRQLAVAGGPSE